MRGFSLLPLALLAACEAQPERQTQTGPAPAAASAAPSSAAWDKLQALGTEPFWSVEIAAGSLRYSTPENNAGTAFPAERRIDGARQTYTGMLEGKPFTLVIEPGQCSDGMSDTVYPFAATRTLAGDVQRGCARPR